MIDLILVGLLPTTVVVLSCLSFGLLLHDIIEKSKFYIRTWLASVWLFFVLCLIIGYTIKEARPAHEDKQQIEKAK